MLPLPYSPIFFFFLLLGPLISISSTSWLLMWVGLEINLMAFIPLLCSSKLFQPTEATTKYFLTQACAGLLLLFGLLISHPAASVLSSLALLLKLGAAPLHFWLPSVMSGASWPYALMIVTWQKFAPLMALTFIIQHTSSIILFSALISTFIGGVMGLNQTQLRAIMAYSSISHMGWMLLSSLISPLICLLYFISYSVMTSAILLLLNHTNSYSLLSLHSPLIKPFSLLFIPLLLSLAGVPPLMGFAPKVLTIYLLLINKAPLMALIALMASLMNLYYYLNLAFSSLPHTTFALPLSPLPQPTIFLPLLILLSLLGLPLFLLMTT